MKKKFICLLLFLVIFPVFVNAEQYTAMVINKKGITVNGKTIAYGTSVDVLYDYCDLNLECYSYIKDVSLDDDETIDQFYDNKVLTKDIRGSKFDLSNGIKCVKDETQSCSIVFESDMNIYNGPSFSFEKIGTLPKNNKIAFEYFSSEGWRYITYNGISGWVYDRENIDGYYLKTDTNYKLEVIRDINLLDNNGSKLDTIINKGTELMYLGYSYDSDETLCTLYYVEYNNTRGFISDKNVIVLDDGISTKEYIVGDAGKVSLYSVLTNEKVDASKYLQDGHLYTLYANNYLLSNKKIGLYDAAQDIFTYVIKLDDNYYYVYSNDLGYVYMSFNDVYTLIHELDSDSWRIDRDDEFKEYDISYTPTGDDVEVRNTPLDNAKVIGKLDKGTKYSCYIASSEVNDDGDLKNVNCYIKDLGWINFTTAAVENNDKEINSVDDTSDNVNDSSSNNENPYFTKKAWIIKGILCGIVIVISFVVIVIGNKKEKNNVKVNEEKL